MVLTIILEFPIQDAGEWHTTNYSITNQRRRREHQKLTRLLNLLLAGTTKFMPDRRRHFWAHVQCGGGPQFKWVPEWYDANIGQIVLQDLSAPVGKELEEIDSDKYYKERELCVPSDPRRVNLPLSEPLADTPGEVRSRSLLV
jgi:hypothetical protein